MSKDAMEAVNKAETIVKNVDEIFQDLKASQGPWVLYRGTKLSQICVRDDNGKFPCKAMGIIYTDPNYSVSYAPVPAGSEFSFEANRNTCGFYQALDQGNCKFALKGPKI